MGGSSSGLAASDMIGCRASCSKVAIVALSTDDVARRLQRGDGNRHDTAITVDQPPPLSFP